MATFRDFSGRHVLPVVRFERPVTLGQLCGAVRRAEAEGLPAHAVGSAWAFSAPAYCEGVMIDTEELANFPDWLQRAVIAPSDRAKLHVAVEGGIKVHNLDLALNGEPRRDGRPGVPWLGRRRLSLPTHGGAGGQSLVGAFTTGTHGGDVARPLIADFVRALIVVGSGGAVRVVQRAGREAVAFDRVVRELRQRSGARTTVLDERSMDSLDAVLVSVGRFGVIYAVVVEVHDEQNFPSIEVRRKKPWSRVEEELRAGTIVRDAQARDDFLQVVISPVRERGDRQCYETMHRSVPRARLATAGEEFGLGRIPSRDVVAERQRAALPPIVGQAFCADRLTPELRAAREILLALGVLMSLQFPPFGAIAAIPIFEAAASIARIGRDHRLGDVIADVLNLATRSGFPQVLEAVNAALLNEGQSDQIKLPPPAQPVPWLVHGTRAQISDFQDYDSDCYRGDSVELFFPADRALPDKVNQVLDVFEQMRARGTPIGSYVSLRFLAASSTLLGLTAASPSCAIEISMLRGLEGNTEALDRLQEVARRNGGRLHWGQQNDASPRDISTAYGDRLARWKRKLHDFEAESLTFSTPFSRARGLETAAPGNPWRSWTDAGIVARSSPAAVSAGGGMPLEVFAVDDTMRVKASRRPASGAEPWRRLRPERVDPDATPVPIRVRDGRIELFCRWDDRIKHCWEQGRPGGEYSEWDEKGAFPGRGPRIRDLPAVAEHLDRRLEVFAREQESPNRMLHCYQHGGVLGGTWSAVFTRTERAMGGPPSACVRNHTGSGGVTDQMIVVCTAPADDVGGVPFGTVIFSVQRGPGSDSGWRGWSVLAPPGGRGMVVGGGGSPLAVNVFGPGMRPHVLAIDALGQVHEALDDDRVVALGWEPWRPLPPLHPTRRLDSTSRLVTVQSQNLWLFGRSIRGNIMAIQFVPGSGWRQWLDLGGAGIGDVAAAVADDGRVEVFVKPASGGRLRVRRQTAPGRW